MVVKDTKIFHKIKNQKLVKYRKNIIREIFEKFFYSTPNQQLY